MHISIEKLENVAAPEGFFYWLGYYTGATIRNLLAFI